MTNRRTRFRICSQFLSALVWLAALGVCGCASTPSGPSSRLAQDGFAPPPAPEAKATPIDDKSIRPGYLLHFSHAEDPKLNRDFRVTFEGELVLPYGVRIPAVGSALPELQAKVNAAYRRYFHGAAMLPRVKIAAKTLWVEVRGLVAKPSRYLVRRDASLDEAIAKAGGLLPNSGAAFVKLQQGDRISVVELSRYYNEGDSRLLPNWQGGDVLFLQREATGATDGTLRSVTLLGEVHRPGEFAFHGHSDLFYYLTKAGGPTQFADLKSIQIRRGTGAQRETTEVDLTAPKPVPIEAGDLILVAPDTVAPFEKHMPLIGALASVVGALAVFLVAL